MTTSTTQDSDATYPTWDDLDAAVLANGGVLRVSMLDLRQTSSKSRLKSLVVAEIEKELKNKGIGHLPAVLPRSQHEHAVLYKMGEPIGQVISAIQNEVTSEDAAKTLRQLNTSDQVQAAAEQDTRLSGLAEKVDELGELVEEFRSILGDRP